MNQFETKGDKRILEVSVSKDGRRREVILQTVIESERRDEAGNVLRKAKLSASTHHQRRVNGDWADKYPPPYAERSKKSLAKKESRGA